jgi:hypothetical protein
VIAKIKICHPERSKNIREADVLTESKDPVFADTTMDLARRSHDAFESKLVGSIERTPCNGIIELTVLGSFDYTEQSASPIVLFRSR